MGEQSEAAAKQVYVVQRHMRLYEAAHPEPDVDRVEVGKPHFAWVDVATVTVPSRTHRKTVIEKALEQAGVVPEPNAEPMRVRVLDADSAKVSEVGSVQPPAQLVIGG